MKWRSLLNKQPLSVKSEEQHKIDEIDMVLRNLTEMYNTERMGHVAPVACAKHDSVNVAQWLLSLNAGDASLRINFDGSV
jgi:hypothetical protein